MTLKELLTPDTWNVYGDMDVINDTTDSVFPAWCGTGFTPEGEKEFSAVLALDAEIVDHWMGTVLCVNFGDAYGSGIYKAAKRMFWAMAGYCSEEEYNRWFDNSF